MCCRKNFTDVLRTLTLQNASRLLLLKYLLKIKIAASDKFRSSHSQIIFKIDGLKKFALITNNKIAGLKALLKALLKRDSNTGVYL